MLKEKTPQNNLKHEVVAIKLGCGDEVIAHLVRNDKEGVLVVRRPLAMVMAEDPSNATQTRVMFTPWMVAANDSDIEINMNHVISVVKARESAATQYEQAVA